ncbi:hypothetical protein KY338_05910 [Candidatus Woesearchaeota archaeon]|nr:hypothetical protein [Candidatus Woesearchaeota archaeon]MBW3006291.1 hypothetical protein [Candidatus Woesearchaeota archaeon]
MIKGHRIEKEIAVQEFLDIISSYSPDKIKCTGHTFFRLSEEQRKFFKCKELKVFLLEKVPVLAGLQHNKNHAVFYEYKENTVIRLILDISLTGIQIVTFYIIGKKNIPRMQK